MVTTVDARGMPCPQPVILTKKAMREAEEVITLVSGEDQVGNVRRLAERAGWQVTVEKREDAYAVHLTKGQATVEPQVTPDLTVCSLPTKNTVLVVSSDQMGRGDPELGAILVRTFFHTLAEGEQLPNTIIFYNSGVKLAVEGSPVLEDLRALEAMGIELLACGTCLGYYNLKERITVGTISNMYTIAEKLLSADCTVTV
jgi:selenium metabolism protein YedF